MCDVLEVIINPTGSDEFTSSGIFIDGKPSDNLCLKALALIRGLAPVPPLKIHLHKAIPIGAGLGGGSSDASFMLKLLNQKFAVGLSDSDLEQLATSLGADCPVFIKNLPVFARGIGNEFYRSPVNLSGKWLHVITPPIHVPTAGAYSNVTPRVPSHHLHHLLQAPIENWRENVLNDFEPHVFNIYPEIRDIKARLYSEGAQFALMSGSGSSLFGIFDSKPTISWPRDYRVHTEKIG